MKALTLSRDSFDQDNTFTILVKGYKRMKNITASLHHHDECGYYALKESVCLKDQYTEKDVEESRRLQAMDPLKDGEIVTIDGNMYTVKVNGDYSDCAVFNPV